MLDTEIHRMLERSDRLQWSVDDVDWDGPGREELGARAGDYRRFLADLVWIERAGAVAFETLADQTDDPTLHVLLAAFARDEHRHADAELALMARWGLLAPGETIPPPPPVEVILTFLGERGTKVAPSVYAAIIPLFEIVLDGALIKHLTGTVADPVCHQMFELVNRDEARHLATDFHLLERIALDRALLANAIDMLRTCTRPDVLAVLFTGYLPLLRQGTESLVRLGVDPATVNACMDRYVELGRTRPALRRHPAYRVLSWQAQMMTAREGRPYGWLADALTSISHAVA